MRVLIIFCLMDGPYFVVLGVTLAAVDRDAGDTELKAPLWSTFQFMGVDS